MKFNRTDPPTLPWPTKLRHPLIKNSNKSRFNIVWWTIKRLYLLHSLSQSVIIAFWKLLNRRELGNSRVQRRAGGVKRLKVFNLNRQRAMRTPASKLSMLCGCLCCKNAGCNSTTEIRARQSQHDRCSWCTTQVVEKMWKICLRFVDWTTPNDRPSTGWDLFWRNTRCAIQGEQKRNI